MRLSLVAVLLAGLFVFALPILAQSSSVAPEIDTPILEENAVAPVPAGLSIAASGLP